MKTPKILVRRVGTAERPWVVVDSHDTRHRFRTFKAASLFAAGLADAAAARERALGHLQRRLTLSEMTDDDGLDLGGRVRLIKSPEGGFAYQYLGPLNP